MELFHYRYIPKDIVLTLDKNYEMDDGCITYFSMVHDYDTRKLPIIHLKIEVQTSLIAMLYKYAATSGRIKINIIEKQYNSEEEVVGSRSWLNYTWSYIPAKNQTEYLTSEDIQTEQMVDEMKEIQLFDCYLIDTDALNWFSKQISTAMRGSKPAVLQALLEMRDIKSGIVVATPPEDNGWVTAILPYGDLIGNISYLNNRYGIYSSTPMVYYDMEYFYLVDRLKPNIKMSSATEFSEVQLMLYNANNPIRQTEGSCNDRATNAHYINVKEDPIFTDYSQRKENTKFSTITTIDEDGNVSKINLSGAQTADDNESDSTAMTYQFAYNDYNEQQIINDSLSRGRNAVVHVNNICVSFLKPYKRFTFVPDTQYTNLNLSGIPFRLKGWSIMITREGAGSNGNYLHDVTISLFEQLVV